eukprot:IDg21309t1
MARNSHRVESAYEYAVAGVLEEGLTLRAAVAAALAQKRVTINRATLARRVASRRRGPGKNLRSAGRPPALSVDQEEDLASVCRYHAQRGAPVVYDEIAGLVKQARQAAERYRSTNAEVLTEHMLNLQDVYRSLQIDATRIFNLDETGMTAAKDCHGTSTRKSIMPTGQRCHLKGTDFEAISRVSLLASISAAGDSVLPFGFSRERGYLTVQESTQMGLRKLHPPRTCCPQTPFWPPG